MGQRGIDIQRLASNLVLFVGWLGPQRAHVVEAVADFDEDDADVVTHRQQQLLEGLGLCRSLVAEDTAGNLGQAIYNLSYLGAEDVVQILHRVLRVLHDIVEQRGTDTGGPQTDFATDNLRHGQRVHDIRFSRQAPHALVGLAGKVESLGDEIYFLTMGRGEIGLNEALISGLHHFLVLLGLRQDGVIIFFHSGTSF